MKIGLIPMSAKPYHAGHHMLVELAAISEITDEIKELSLPVNDHVVVFVSFTSRGVRTIKDPKDRRSLKQGAKKIEVPKPGETAIFGSDMRYIWSNLLKPNLKLPKKVKIISPDDGAGPAPVQNVHEVCAALKEAYDNKEKMWTVPFTNIKMPVKDTVINIYSDDQDIVTNYADDAMTKLYGRLWNNPKGPSIRGIGIPRAATVEISGTKMRSYLCKGDIKNFVKLLPPLPEDVKKEIAKILADSASCGLPMDARKSKVESLLRAYVRNMVLL